MSALVNDLSKLRAVIHNIETVIQGKSSVVEQLLVCLLAEGHLLLEDMPGVGKTTLVKALASSISLRFSRIQFTPDLLPQDLLGTNVLNPSDGTFTFHGGPVFTNLLLADEINRASPRTQSALLEAMNEQQVTIDSVSRALSPPFMVVATQNPVEFQGTYPLPEAQLDRFMMRLSVGYPDPADELQILQERQKEDPLKRLMPVMRPDDLAQLQRQVRDVIVSDDVAKYILRLVARTRHAEGVSVGLSPRASLALYRAVQARAFVHERPYVSPEDVQVLFPCCMSHRLVLSSAAQYGGRSVSHIVSEILEAETVPV
ncbi:MAG: MoxR family ATPase [Deltaproteobacteria bacterium]|nr:MoxR family ATPase [Deltaproteobacteria bacterium]MBN2670858.1 MoxR family ATPase [Deltaproteobacteria bacterium]